MKDVILKERKPSERLIKLVDAIPELKIDGSNVRTKNDNAIYGIHEGDIAWATNINYLEDNPLRNVTKIKEVYNKGIQNVTEESFCDLLREHLYLTAKDKLAELLPQIQEHYPDATLEDDQILIMLGSDNPEWVAEIQNTQVVAGWGGSYGQSDIWKDADKLIVKAPKPWWETQTYFYKLYIDRSLAPYKMAMIKCDMFTHSVINVGKNAGKTMFKTKEEAEVMCNKINAVLKGEIC